MEFFARVHLLLNLSGDPEMNVTSVPVRFVCSSASTRNAIVNAFALSTRISAAEADGANAMVR
jgi:hypothetical protein